MLEVSCIAGARSHCPITCNNISAFQFAPLWVNSWPRSPLCRGNSPISTAVITNCMKLSTVPFDRVQNEPCRFSRLADHGRVTIALLIRMTALQLLT